MGGAPSRILDSPSLFLGGADAIKDAKFLDEQAITAVLSVGDETPPDGESVGRTLWGLAKFGFYFWGVTTYVVDLTLCTGPSMEPTLNANSDLVLLDRVSPRLGRIATGDIVVADSPTRPGETVCKRVSAVAGERIPGSFFADVVPPGCVWLLGDNRRNSTDSRIYGSVPKDVIKGRVVLRVWPLDQARLFI